MFKKRLEDNIWKYAIQLMTNKRIFAAVLSIYYLTIPDVTVQSVGVIIGIGMFAGFLLEIPSGYVADRIGHKQALVLSNLLFLASSLGFYFSTNYFSLIVAAILMSAGNAFNSGTGMAFIHETITALNREKDYVRIVGKIRAIGFTVPAIIAALVPFLIVYGYKTPFLVAIVIDLIGLISVMSLVVPVVKKEKVEGIELGPTNFLRVFKEIKHYNLFPGMLFSAFISSFAMTLGQFRGPYQESIGVAVIWFGIFHSSGRVLASLMLWFSGKLHAKISPKSVRLLKVFIFSGLALVLAFVDNKIAVVASLILINAFLYGLSGLGGEVTHRKLKNSSLKATIFSVKAQIQNILSAALSPLFGFLILNFGYKKSFLVFGIIFLIVSYLIHLNINKRSEMGDDDSGGE